MANKAPGPLIRTLHRIVALPAVYELVQRIAGRRRVTDWLGVALPPLSGGLVLDVGSASGEHARHYARKTVSLDIDIVPLVARRRSLAGALVVCADATALPFLNRAVTASLFIATSHHLPDDSLSAALGELARVTSGQIVFMDAVRDRRLVSRLLWRMDRGAHPRTPENLEQMIAAALSIVGTSSLRVLHRYRLYVCVPRDTPNRATNGTPAPPR